MQPGKKKSCGDQVKLCCCKYSTEGSVTFTVDDNFTAENASPNKVSRSKNESSNYVKKNFFNGSMVLQYLKMEILK